MNLEYRIDFKTLGRILYAGDSGIQIHNLPVPSYKRLCVAGYISLCDNCAYVPCGKRRKAWQQILILKSGKLNATPLQALGIVRRSRLDKRVRYTCNISVFHTAIDLWKYRAEGEELGEGCGFCGIFPCRICVVTSLCKGDRSAFANWKGARSEYKRKKYATIIYLGLIALFRFYYPDQQLPNELRWQKS